MVLLVFNILNLDASRALFLPQLFLFLLMSLVETAPLREWGTRYDSLSTSPSPSTASSLSRINPPTTCTSTANSSLLTAVDTTPTKPRAQGDRLSHEASVFVGRCSRLPFMFSFMHRSLLFSLPTNVDHTELSARLRDHLSAYADVNLVRIIRDTRGGVCAFVQCNVNNVRRCSSFSST